MTDSRIDALLANRHTALLQWNEVWRALDADGNKADAHVTLRATVDACIGLRRRADLLSGRPAADDRTRLEEFMMVNWATVAPPEKEGK